MKTLPLIILFALLTLPAEAFLVPTNPAPSVQLAWDASPSPGVTNYYMYWGTGSGQYTNKVLTGNVLTFGVSNLVRGVTYYFAVTATGGGLESSFSNEVNYQPPNPPAPPTMKPVVVLVVETKTDLRDFAWADTPMNWTLSPEQAEQYYRLEVATISPPAPKPKLRVIAPPPPPPVTR